MSVACSCHAQPCGAAGRLAGVGQGVGAGVGVLLGVGVGVGDGVFVAAGVADGLAVAVWGMVAEGRAVGDGRVSTGKPTGAVSGISVKALGDGGTAEDLSAASFSRTGTQADKIQSSKKRRRVKRLFTIFRPNCNTCFHPQENRILDLLHLDGCDSKFRGDENKASR